MKKNDNFKEILRFTSIPFEMFIIIFLSYKLGDLLDIKFKNIEHLYSISLTLVGVFISMGFIIWRIKKFKF